MSVFYSEKLLILTWEKAIEVSTEQLKWQILVRELVTTEIAALNLLYMEMHNIHASNNPSGWSFQMAICHHLCCKTIPEAL